ncbi:hypothetical protein JCM10908_002217 [Rhodotorula pacifica]|uniref:uncharacterized protein n=1 Tax=Rhodotorula pacifica TaxID=1495444 RepID=UPI003172D9EE
MESPTPSLREVEDPYDSLSSGPPLPLPPGVYTLLPLAEACDNLVLPDEPVWDDHTCKKRWDEHVERASSRQKGPEPTLAQEESALADDDDEEEDEDDFSTQTTGDEFLTPLFVALPTPAPGTATSARSTPARRRSSAASQRPMFSAMTPVTASLCPSSPTPSGSYAAPAPSQTEAHKTLSSRPIGFLRPSIVRALIEDNRRLVSMNCKPVWAFSPPIAFPPPPPKTPERRRSSVARSRSASVKLTRTQSFYEDEGAASSGGLKLDDVLAGLKAMSLSAGKDASGPYAVGFEDWVNAEGTEARREHVDRIVRGWKARGLFPECLGGWRDEEYVIYAPGPGYGTPSTFRGPKQGDANPLPGSNEAFRMERSACSLFGVTTFGVHLTAYVEEQDDKPLRIWVPRRSPNKQTWPSMLDNTVAGGITAGDLPRKSVIRECAEEASLDPLFVATRVRQTGVITYNYRTSEGWLSPEVQYCFDLKLPDPETEEGAREGVIPTTNPADGEVESFSLMPVEEVVERMIAGEFKPNCALVLLDFFIRHGLLTAESDTRFLEIVSHLHRPMTLPGPA